MIKLSRAEQQKADLEKGLRELLDKSQAVAHLSSPEPLEALIALGDFVEQNAALILKAIRQADFRTDEEWRHDEDERYFDEEYR